MFGSIGSTRGAVLLLMRDGRMRLVHGRRLSLPLVFSSSQGRCKSIYNRIVQIESILIPKEIGRDRDVPSRAVSGVQVWDFSVSGNA